MYSKTSCRRAGGRHDMTPPAPPSLCGRLAPPNRPQRSSRGGSRGRPAVAYQGSERPCFNSNLGALSFPPLPQPSPSPLPRSGPQIQLGGPGERYKLPQRGLGWSPSRNRICCILALKSVIWWQQF